MSIFGRIGERVREGLKSWLRINDASERSFSIIEHSSREAEIIRAKLWYRGDADELFQFFHQLETDGIKGSFWGSVPASGTVRKAHSGLPAIIADMIAYIVKSDLDCIKAPAEWEELSEQLSFTDIVGKAIVDTLVEGDGAFRISVADGELPRLEFVEALRCEYEDGAVSILTEYQAGSRLYTLKERYSTGRVESRLYDDNGNEVPLMTVPELAGVLPAVEFDGDYSLAVRVMFFTSKKYEGRGKSVFDGGRSDCFDALDEVISQWWDSVRAGRVRQYIPESMIPRNPETGALIKPTQFGNSYISVSAPLQEGVAQEIKTVQPEIDYEAYESAYMNALLMCLQGLISPATLGIDVGKMSSQEAQREKKDVTGSTRNTITAVLEKVLPKVIEAIFKTLDNMRGQKPEDREVSVSFGEYGAPDFDSRVETVGKAATYGVMSVETQVSELWGSSKDDEWKAAETKRIMYEKGLITVDEPSIGGA